MTTVNGYGTLSSTTSVNAVLKEIYVDANYYDDCYKTRPFLGMIRKYENFGGRDLPVPQRYTRPIGVSAAFQYASQNATPSNLVNFLVTRTPLFGTVTLTGEVMLADAAKDEFTFVSYMKTEIDGAMQAWSDQMSSLLFGSGTGTFGRVSAGSTVSSNLITLASINDIVNFEVGMTLVASATDGAAPRTGQEVILKVNRTAGTLTSTSAAWNTVITALAAGDYLSVQGNTSAVIKGIGAWNPKTQPTTGDSFLGVDRSVDPTRLSGLRYDGSSLGLTIEEIIQNAAALLYRESGIADTLLMNPYDAIQLQKSQQSRVYYPREGSKRMARSGKGDSAVVGFNTLSLNTMGLDIDVVVDPKCPQGTGYMVQMDAVELASLGPAPQFLEQDGLWINRIPLADAYQCRIGFYGAFLSRNTLNSCNITFPTGNQLP
jgi:hypothetical protein